MCAAHSAKTNRIDPDAYVIHPAKVEVAKGEPCANDICLGQENPSNLRPRCAGQRSHHDYKDTQKRAGSMVMDGL